jgi:hypothetical protein
MLNGRVGGAKVTEDAGTEAGGGQVNVKSDSQKLEY